MPKFKVGFPYIVVEAPDERAALAAYDQFMEGWGSHDGFGPEATVVGDTPDYAVDAEGYEIVDGECTPSTKHPGRCAECGEPMDTREELPADAKK